MISNETLIYLVASSAIFSSILAIFVVFTRKTEYIQIVENYSVEIDKIKKHTNNILSEFRIEYKNLLKELNQDTNEKLKETFNSTFDIHDKLRQIRDRIDYVDTKLEQHFEIVDKLEECHQGIKERDASINRKRAQIDKLKKEKNALQNK